MAWQVAYPNWSNTTGGTWTDSRSATGLAAGKYRTFHSANANNSTIVTEGKLNGATVTSFTVSMTGNDIVQEVYREFTISAANSTVDMVMTKSGGAWGSASMSLDRFVAGQWVNIDSGWRQVTGTWVNIDGGWRQVIGTWVNIDGVWRQC